MNSVAAATKRAEEYANKLNIDVFRGLQDYKNVSPVLMPMDDYGRPMIHKYMDEGIDYYLSRIDYFDDSYNVIASRYIYLIAPGHNNQAAYLPSKARTKIIEIHLGGGYLMLSRPETEYDDDFQTDSFLLSPDVTPAITITPDNFYVFEASDWHQEPFVISELVINREVSSKRPKEISFQPHADELITDGASIKIPLDFSSYSFV